MKSIGSATMEDDRTLVLDLRAEDAEEGIIGDARFVYPPDHPEYDAVLDHIGEIEPGESKPVPPWGDK